MPLASLGIGLLGEPLTPCCNKGAIWYERYQRRTLTGIGRRKKTVRSCTGKTPRTIVPATSANTSASIMVRFFCILCMMTFELNKFNSTKKLFF